jgi:hypothetical protein
MEVEHILPIELDNDDAAKATKFGELRLPLDFDLNSLENLVPACRSCNKLKRNLNLPPGLVGIFLERARVRTSSIRDAIPQRLSEHQREKHRVSFLIGLENGAYTVEEALELIAAEDRRNGIMSLSCPYEVFPGQSIFELDQGAIARLYHHPIDVNAEPGMMLHMARGDYLKDEEESIKVNTLNQYLEATEAGFYPHTNMGMKLADTWFVTKIALLRKLQKARVPDLSFIDGISVNDIGCLPASALFLAEDVTEDEAVAGQRAFVGARSVRQLANMGEATILDTATGLIHVRYAGYETLLIEQFRADVNGDGLEEMVVYSSGRPETGTMRLSEIRTFVRTSPNALLTGIADDPDGLISAVRAELQSGSG